MIMFNNDLLRDLAEQRVVLFLGAGVSASAMIGDQRAFKDWREFLVDAASGRPEALKQQVNKLIGEKDFLLACQLLQDSYGTDWEAVVTAEYGKVAPPSALHEALLSLNQRIVVTTNFDKLYETAWRQRIGQGGRDCKVLSSVDSDMFRSLRDHDQPYLIKIHGTIDRTSALVFSRSEYIRMAFGNKNYAQFLESMLLNYTFLFVGFSMDDPAVSSVMELYAFNYPTARPHYIFSPVGMPDNLVEFNKRLRKLAQIHYDPSNNHAELALVVEKLGEAARESRRLLVASRMSAV